MDRLQFAEQVPVVTLLGEEGRSYEFYSNNIIVTNIINEMCQYYYGSTSPFTPIDVYTAVMVNCDLNGIKYYYDIKPNSIEFIVQEYIH